MRVFKHPNMINFECPICKTSEDKEVTLVGVLGTEDGNTMKAIQVHVDCLSLNITDDNIIYMKF